MFNLQKINCRQTCAPPEQSDTVVIDMKELLERQEREVLANLKREEAKLAQVRRKKEKHAAFSRRRSSSRERRGTRDGGSSSHAKHSLDVFTPETIRENTEKEEEAIRQAQLDEDKEAEAQARYRLEGLRMLVKDSENDLFLATKIHAQCTEEELRLAKERERKMILSAFLKDYGYDGVTVPKRKFLKTTYALHKAAKLGDKNIEVVELLLQSGARLAQKDSRGRTAVDIAMSNDNDGSHAKVLELLRCHMHEEDPEEKPDLRETKGSPALVFSTFARAVTSNMKRGGA